MIKILGAVACVLAVVAVMLAASVAAWAGQTNELEVNRAPMMERRLWNWKVQPVQAQTQEASQAEYLGNQVQGDPPSSLVEKVSFRPEEASTNSALTRLLYQQLLQRGAQAQAPTPEYFQLATTSQAGTWQIVTAAEHVLLLNTSTGATFRLVDKGTVRWEAVTGQHATRAGDPILIPWTRTIPEVPAKSLKVLEHELAVAEVALSDLKSALKHVSDRDTRTKLEREIKARSEKTVELQKQVEAARLREAVPAPAEKR